MPPKATLFDIRYSICADRDVVNAAGLELVHDAQPELGALALLDPQAQDVLVPLAIESQGLFRFGPVRLS